MRLLSIEWMQLAIPFRRSIGTAAGPHVERSLLLVRVETETGVGWGECGALGPGTSVDPSVATMIDAVRSTAIGRMAKAAEARRGELVEALSVARLFSPDAVGRQLGAVFEMAVLDAELKAEHLSLAHSLGTAGRQLAMGAAVGIPESRDCAQLVDDVGEHVQRGVVRIRLKIEPGWDVEPVRAVREAYPDLLLAADANGSFALNDGLERLDPFGLAYVEQPLAPGDLAAHCQLAQRITTPVCLDESLSSPRRVTDAIRYGACAVACLKPSRLGGLWATRTALEECQRAGISAFVGGFFETGLGRSANLALAGLAGFALPGDLVAPDTYLVADPVGYPTSHNGLVTAPESPGVATLDDPSRLEEWIVARERVSFPD